MRVIEVLEFSRDILFKLKESGIRIGDCRYIGMYNEFVNMRESGEKVTYTAHFLAEKHKVSVRKVYSVVKHFSAECVQHD